jgi:hypothetical protein
MRKMQIALGGIFAAGTLLAGCATAPTPLYTKTNTTLGQVDMTGLVCRREVSTKSRKPETVCASPEQWAAFDKRMQTKNDQIFAAIRRESISNEPNCARGDRADQH